MADLKESFWLYGQDGSMHRAHTYEDSTARLQDGTFLNYVDENTFKNEVTGELLSRKAKKKVG
jgi:hypothetical protein